MALELVILRGRLSSEAILACPCSPHSQLIQRDCLQKPQCYSVRQSCQIWSVDVCECPERCTCDKSSVETSGFILQGPFFSDRV